MKEWCGGILEKMSMTMMIQVDFGSEQILDSRSMCTIENVVFFKASNWSYNSIKVGL